jgi:hypothetical protein
MQFAGGEMRIEDLEHGFAKVIEAQLTCSDEIQSTPELNNIEYVVSNSIEVLTDSNLLKIKKGSGAVIFIDLFKLMSGISGLLSAIGALSISANILAALSVIGALGNIKGYKVRLMREQSIICCLLLDCVERQMSLDDLEEAFKVYIAHNPNVLSSSNEYENALIELENLGCIKTRGNNVSINQMVLVGN